MFDVNLRKLWNFEGVFFVFGILCGYLFMILFNYLRERMIILGLIK